MEQFSHLATRIFKEAIAVYEREGSIDTPPINPYQPHTIEHDLFRNFVSAAFYHRNRMSSVILRLTLCKHSLSRGV